MPSPAKEPLAEIPKFALYGEQTRTENAEFVHIELIETRSRMYDWHIDNHTHPGMFQVLFYSVAKCAPASTTRCGSGAARPC